MKRRGIVRVGMLFFPGPAVCGAALLACGCDVSGPSDLLPPFDGDPATVVLPAEVGYACDHWYPADPTVGYGLFDVYYRTVGYGLFDVYYRDVGDGPTAEDRAGILRLNGVIVHEFNVPVIRAVLQPIAVPELAAARAWGVPDVTVFPVEAAVEWRWREGPSPTLADTLYVESLGGVFLGRGPWGDRSSSLMLLPDSAIPLMRAYPEVLLIQLPGWACVL